MASLDRFTVTDIREKYDDFAAGYVRFSAIEGVVLGTRRLRRQLMSQAHGRVLDVACGSGQNFPYFNQAKEVIAIDLSDEMVALARQEAKKQTTPIEVRQGDATELPFPDNHFDTVTTALSTCTFPDTPAVLRELARVCKVDGHVLLLEHGRSSTRWFANFQDRRAEKHYESVGCRWAQEPQELVNNAGLDILESSRHRLGVFHVIKAKPRPSK